MHKVTMKQAFFYLSKWLGLFYLTSYATRNCLRILCFHGISLNDEHLFRPKLFISHATFKKRLSYLQTQGYPVLSLEEALTKLKQGCLPNCATVITIDDGFYNFYKLAFDSLQKHSFPVTVYVTTYYSVNETPIFRLVIQYIFWKTTKEYLDSSQIDPDLKSAGALTDAQYRETTMWNIIHIGETQPGESERVALAQRVANLLLVDLSHVEQDRLLSLMKPEEISFLASQGVDIQLHTHRHRLPVDEEQCLKEINENKAILEPLVGKPLHHFCYPNGQWTSTQWPWLTAAGITSATRCEPGLNYQATPNLALHRYLDSEEVSQIEFEAELSGFSEVLRLARSRLRNYIG